MGLQQGAVLALFCAAAMLGGTGLAIGRDTVPCEEKPSCTGCGCKGGPGYRELRTNKCVSFRELTKKCGNPPDEDRCRFENAPGTGENFWCALDLPTSTPNPYLDRPS